VALGLYRSEAIAEVIERQPAGSEGRLFFELPSLFEECAEFSAEM